MAATAIGVTIWGGWAYALLWTGVAAIVAWEWQKIIAGPGANALAAASSGVVVLLIAVAAASSWPLLWLAIASALLCSAGIFLAAPSQGTAFLGGCFYAYALGASALLCRGGDFNGLIVVLWLFAAVWGTDIVAYFTGRALGGPKLWPRVSPKKTWSGALGGLVGGLLLSALLLWGAGAAVRWQHLALSIAFSILTQAGDLFESAFKRRFGVKDSGRLIPGHGGFMDRLDGFVFAVVFAAAFGGWRSGSAVPDGLLVWP